ncbi:MAG: DUF5131 family protein, partial [Gammaproteobacteria bacterium]|nr:DUF5131 family protein [Gammaproteobacteria bacterium]
MATSSRIEWTEHTWNPTTGCTKVSPGCRYCYAEIMAKRFPAPTGLRLSAQGCAKRYPGSGSHGNNPNGVASL